MKDKSEYTLEWAVYIGRFEPYHNGHHATALEALKRSRRLIFSLGSANSPRTISNPWTAEEREAMIRSAFSEEDNERIRFIYIEDRLYQNSEWALLVREAVRSTLFQYHAGRPEKANIGLVEAAKDDTSWYVNLFPDWKDKCKIDITYLEDGDAPIGATKIRELIFTNHSGFVSHAVPEGVYNQIKKDIHTNWFADLKLEYANGIAYERLYENSPKGHSVNFYTADNVVYQSGHVLLIKRKHSPGKGLWALPGGHVNPNETAEDGSIRELFEETSIKITEGVLRLSLKNVKIFDHPDRSLRARITKKNARTVTISHFYKLDDSKELARVKGGDDAEEAWWFPVETIKQMRNELFEDHLDQILYHCSRIER